MGALVRLSAARASHFYGLVFPRERWWMRLFTSVANLYYRLRRSPFRVFLHATAAVDALIREAGLRPHFRQETLAWQVVVYRRV
jgi:hypothetical protein